MQALIASCGLTDLGENVQDCDTYHNPFLGHRSHIDHALIRKHKGGNQWSPLSIAHADDESNASNSSYHVPIMTTLNLNSALETPRTKPRSKVEIKYKWDEMDKTGYANTINEELSQYNITLLDPNNAINTLQHVIATATLDSTPHRKVVQSQGPKNTEWTPELAEAVKDSKKAHYEWKQAGRPSSEDPLWMDKKRTKSKVRAIQRKQKWAKRKELREKISDAAENDRQLFSHLLKLQSKDISAVNSMLIDGNTITDEDSIRSCWADYFEGLAAIKPSEDQEDEILRYMRILAQLNGKDIMVDREMLDSAINALRNKKASDKQGIAAEQIKALTPTARDMLVSVYNEILSTGTVPEIMKVAYKLPIAKKGKDSRIMDNYRGITIASLFGKILELLCLQGGLEEHINTLTSPLQCGFTKERSPTMASLLITETIAESKAQKKPLFIASLDARKAFDVVNQCTLKKKCYQSDMNRQMWCIIDSLYSEGTEVVRWNGIDSRHYQVQKGVKQGGILSPHLYKVYINDLLQSLQHHRIGTSIGTTFLGVPTCADDVLLISSDPYELQTMLDVAYDYSREHQYELHPQKSVVIQMVPSKVYADFAWTLGDQPVAAAEQFTHLGLSWRSGQPTPDIKDHITNARRTSYALIGVGLHGTDGLDPPASLRTIQLYVLPRLLYGLDAVPLNKTQLQMLDGYVRTLFRQIQGLSENTATEAIYLLLGTVPIEATIHTRTLSLLGSIARLPRTHPIWKLALRQLARPDCPKKSWFTYVEDIGNQYGIDVRKQILYPWPKLSWKSFVKKTILQHWHDKLLEAATKKSTLKRLCLPKNPDEPHPVWLSCQGNPYLVDKAAVRAKMLVGRYLLQSDLAKFSKGNSSPSCQLCGATDEDTVHFLIECPMLSTVRQDKIEQLQQLYQEEDLCPPKSREELVSAILNGSYYRSDNRLISTGDDWRTMRNITKPGLSQGEGHTLINLQEHREGANKIASALCHHLHTERDILINTALLGGSP